MVNLSGFSKIGNNIIGSIQNYKVKKDELNLIVRNTKPLNNNLNNLNMHNLNKGNGLTKEGEELFNKMELNISHNSNNNSFEENGGNFESNYHNDNYKVEKNGQQIGGSDNSR